MYYGSRFLKWSGILLAIIFWPIAIFILICLFVYALGIGD